MNKNTKIYVVKFILNTYISNFLFPTGSTDPEWGILKPLMSVRPSVRACVRASGTVSQRCLDGFIWYFTGSWPISVGLCPSFQILKKVKIGNFTAVFLKKKLPHFKMSQLCSETILRNGLMDSCESFQQNDQHSRDDICFFRLWKKWKLVILWQFCWWFSSWFNQTCMIVCYLYFEIGFSLLSVCFLRIHKGFICSVFDSMVWFEDYNTIYWMFLDLMHDSM